MINIRQINLNRSANNLMYATAAAKNIHAIIMSKQPCQPPDNARKVTCPANDCGIILTRAVNFVADQIGSGQGFTWVQISGIRVYSCYYSPNRPLTEFTAQLAELVDSVSAIPAQVGVIIGGDFNSKSYEWGSSEEDERSRLLSEVAASIDLNPTNVGNNPTYVR